ncbi:Hypothetical protein FKW44_014033, partial [Caligus rogercresseyi]
KLKKFFGKIIPDIISSGVKPSTRIQIWNSLVLPKVVHLMRVAAFDKKSADQIDKICANFLKRAEQKNIT